MAISYKEAQKIAVDLGFRWLADLRRSRDINEAVKACPELAKSSCGIYLQVRPNGIYIGKSRNLVNRHGQHIRQAHEVDYLAFRPVSEEALDAEETKTIALATAQGLPLLNTAKISEDLYLGEGITYDDFCPPEAQDAHLERIHSLKSPEDGRELQRDHSRPAMLELWDEFCEHPAFEEIMRAAALYVGAAIPKPQETAKVFWQTSVMAVNRQNARLPLLRVTCGTDLGVEFYCFMRSPGVVFGTLNVAANFFHRVGFPEHIRQCFPWASVDAAPFEVLDAETLKGHSPYRTLSYPSPVALAKDLPRAVSQAHAYPSVRISFPLSGFAALWNDSKLVEAASAHAIASMRWTRCTKAEQHNPSAEYEILSRLGWIYYYDKA